jgi:hypothetical protein
VKRPLSGPFETVTWPSQLVARVIAPTSPARVHGFDVEADLARHYSFTESVMLALLGELPSEAAVRTFEVAVTFAAPVSVAHGSTHAAVLARICSGSTSAIVGTAAIALGEQARTLATAHAAWLAWLDAGVLDAPLPHDVVTTTPEDRAAVGRLEANLRARQALPVPALALAITRDAAVVAALHACGLRRAADLEVALTWCRLPFVLAEALANAPNAYRDYPLDVPPIVYEEP